MNALPVRLTVDEAWRRWREESSPLAREWLVVHYASLVKFVAGRLAAGLPRQVDTGDLASAGVFGLMGAIERYDPSHGAKFETYAIPRIRGAILDSLRSLDWVPRSVRSRTKSIESAINALEHELGRSPSDEEIAARLEIPVDELQSWLADAAAGAVGPLDHVVVDSQPAPTHGGVQQPDDPGAIVADADMRRVVRSEVGRLPERERTVMLLYYDEGLTLSEIGEVLGVTESRVSQIHSKAVLLLRTRLRAADVA